jgi:hypothetical protein|tara:strand:+ start:50 stop:247 length:198 start_codon:yes stop_codon:yes gene_type:complete
MYNLRKNAILVFKCCFFAEKRLKNATKVVEVLRFGGKWCPRYNLGFEGRGISEDLRWFFEVVLVY